MLTRTLKTLERDGMVERTVRHTTPPQVEYVLTPLGHSLSETARHLADWAAAHQRVIAGNPGFRTLFAYYGLSSAPKRSNSWRIMTASPAPAVPQSGLPPQPAPGFTEFVLLMASLIALGALGIDAMLPALPALGHAFKVTD
eukprot:gene22350-28458_t